MGVTIHFQGILQDKRQINSFIEELTDIAQTMNWEWQILDEDWTKPSTAKLTGNKDNREITGHLALKGITIHLHPDCETLDLFFDAEGHLTSPLAMALYHAEGNDYKYYNSVKTQFAPPDIHITIIKLLKYLQKKYIPNLEVEDEGGYWDSEDKNELEKRLAFINDKIKELGDMFAEIPVIETQQYSAEQLAAIIEERLKNLPGTGTEKQ
ncbi:MAG TPA: hypothetical protein PLP19_11035 [bacterium]|nr:hypothetical protein [bacterium]HPN44015.1 hypothetical protein [bacterium]